MAKRHGEVSGGPVIELWTLACTSLELSLKLCPEQFLGLFLKGVLGSVKLFLEW